MRPSSYCSRDSLIYIAFGSRIVALNYLTGVVVAQASGTDEDPFSSRYALRAHPETGNSTDGPLQSAHNGICTRVPPLRGN